MIKCFLTRHPRLDGVPGVSPSTVRKEVDEQMELLPKMIKLLRYVGTYATVLSVVLETIHCLLVHLGF